MGNSRERGVAGSRSAGLGRRRSGQRPVVGTKGAARPQEGEWDTAPCGALDSRGSLGWTLWGSSHREHPRFSPQPGPPGSPASPGPLDPEAWLWEDKAPVPVQEPTPRWVTRTAAPGGHTGALLCPRGCWGRGVAGAGGGASFSPAAPSSQKAARPDRSQDSPGAGGQPALRDRGLIPTRAQRGQSGWRSGTILQLRSEGSVGVGAAAHPGAFTRSS